MENTITTPPPPPAPPDGRRRQLGTGCAGIAVIVAVFSSVGLLGGIGVPGAGRPRPGRGLPAIDTTIDRVVNSAVVIQTADLATATTLLSQIATIQSWAVAGGHQYRFVPTVPRASGVNLAPACPQQHSTRVTLALPDAAGLTTVLCLHSPGDAPESDLQHIAAGLSSLGISAGVVRTERRPLPAPDEIGTLSTILQVADPAHLAAHGPHHESVLDWVLKTGKEYRLIPPVLTRGECAYDAKVAAIAATLCDVAFGFGRELVFLDMDVLYMGNASRDDLGARLPKSAPDGSRCWFTAQDNYYTINSGVLVLRKTQESVGFVRRWLGWQQVLHVCDGPADQLALQAAVLEFHGRETGWELGGYDGHCETSRLSAGDANGCYMKQMNSFGLPFNRRSTRGLCIVTSKIRFNLHDLHPGNWHPYPTDVLLHQHRIPCRLKEVPNCISFVESLG